MDFLDHALLWERYMQYERDGDYDQAFEILRKLSPGLSRARYDTALAIRNAPDREDALRHFGERHNTDTEDAVVNARREVLASRSPVEALHALGVRVQRAQHERNIRVLCEIAPIAMSLACKCNAWAEALS